MFQINGPVLAAVAHDGEFQEILRQADGLARAYCVELHVCLVWAKLLLGRDRGGGIVSNSTRNESRA